MTYRLIHGDCLEVMRGMADSTVDSVVTDPPYGLEFMGKGWDSFRIDDTGTTRHRGVRAGKQGTKGGSERWGKDGQTIPSGRTAYGGGDRPRTYRCIACGKRDQFRNPHSCGDSARWKQELIDPHAAPPTMLAFQEWSRLWAQEVYRVLKPGGHLVAFGGTRTYHRMTCAIEDAGFEIRDSLHWMYGSGFPKSHNLHDEWEGWGTALKPSHEPIVLARKPLVGTVAANVQEWGTGGLNVGGCRVSVASDEPNIRNNESRNTARGIWGNGAEVGRGPTLQEGRWPPNVVFSHSAGCRRVGERRVRGSHPTAPYGTQAKAYHYDRPSQVPSDAPFDYTDPDGMETVAAWECAEDCPVRALDGQSKGTRAEKPSATGTAFRNDGMFMPGQDRLPLAYKDAGGSAARFYPCFPLDPEYDVPFRYQAKASRRERNEGLGDRAAVTVTDGRTKSIDNPYQRGETLRLNAHPTVKPLALMRWLARLVTPPGGVLLDPFAGSGTTGVAAIQEGFGAVLVEREAEYHAIAEARLEHEASQPRQMSMEIPA